ncbi:MAG: DUF2283 domain-containing protein [Candidatus Bipolaricaulia bacterium]
MRIKYSEGGDGAVIYLKEGQATHGRDLAEGVIGHFDESEQLIKIEILNASNRMDLSEIIVEGLRPKTAVQM